MANTTVKIASSTVGAGGSNTITFLNIPQTFTDLKLIVSNRMTDSQGQTWSDYLIRFNSSTTNYNAKFAYGTGSAPSTSSDASTITIRTSAAGQTASAFGNAEIYIPNYTGSNHKGVSIENVSENNNASSITMLSAGLWANTAAITRIDLVGILGDFAQFSSATLYGIKKA